MIIAFFVCWLPYTTLSVVVVVDPELYIPPLLATMPMYFAKTSPVYNPIIYFLSNKQVSILSVFLLEKLKFKGLGCTKIEGTQKKKCIGIACDAHICPHGADVSLWPTVPWCHPRGAVLRPLHSPRTHQGRHQHVLLKQVEPAYFSEQERQQAQQGGARMTFSGKNNNNYKLPCPSVFVGT